jgi:hypothetical protein
MSKLSRRRSVGEAATGEWLKLVPRLEDETYHLAPRRNRPDSTELRRSALSRPKGAGDDREADP